MKKSTIVDISRETNLSLGVISKFLNGGNVRDKNKELIETAIKKLNYQVDEYARAMVTNRTNTIGIIVPELFNTYYAMVASEIDKCLNNSGYQTIVRESNFDLNREKDAINWFVNRRIDAIIVVSNLKINESADMYKDIETPMVFLDKIVEGINQDFVVVNNREITYEATKFLINNGHTKIAFISAPNNIYTSMERYKGYLQALKENGIEPDESLIYFVDENPDSSYYVAKKIIAEKKSTAIFSSNYTSTLGTIFSLNEMNVKVPNDISLLGFDDIYLTNLFRPKLTIINQPIHSIAHTTVKRVLDRLNDTDNKPNIKILNCELIKGESVLNLKEKSN